MHIQTHILSGWSLANCVELDKRGRLLAMIAATLPDLDGLGILIGPMPFWNYHHLVCHNLPFGLCMAVIFACTSRKHLKAFLLFLGLFHLHLLLDSFGSGRDWTIQYLWPFWSGEFMNPYGWEFLSWQNISIGMFFVLWMVVLVGTKRRTPLECLMPKLDREFVELAARYTKLVRQ